MKITVSEMERDLKDIANLYRTALVGTVKDETKILFEKVKQEFLTACDDDQIERIKAISLYGFDQDDIDTFVSAYIDCALFSSTAYGYVDDESDSSFQNENFDESDLSDDCLKGMRDDCISFMESTWDMIKCNLEQAGHDFWLTRCGHGAGFWDGDWEENGDKLTEISKPYGDVSLYFNDGKIHIM